VRQAIAAAWLPGLLGIGPARVFIFNAGLTTLICALFAEVPAEFFRRHREASDRRTALAAELDDVRARLVRDDDRARRELAEVLHGRLQSRLVAALAKLELARRADEPAIIARLLDEAASYTEEVRTEVLRQGGELAVHSPATCAEAVAELLARYGAMLPLSCTWQLGARELALAPEAVRVVYRLIDEALLNVYRHAHAAHVTLELAIADTGGLRVNLQDDGVGFEPDLVVQGIGLAGPGPVLERLGGRFGLRSKLGHGTTVVIELPPVGAL
jgi:signal transduction histidine kinase